jgi:hypothetical protein
VGPLTRACAISCGLHGRQSEAASREKLSAARAQSHRAASASTTGAPLPPSLAHESADGSRREPARTSRAARIAPSPHAVSPGNEPRTTATASNADSTGARSRQAGPAARSATTSAGGPRLRPMRRRRRIASPLPYPAPRLRQQCAQQRRAALEVLPHTTTHSAVKHLKERRPEAPLLP